MNFRIALAALALMAPALNGCSSDSSKSSSTEAATVGGIEMAVRLPDGSNINSVAYDINHANGSSNDGSVPVENSSLIRFQVGNIPAATGYTIQLSATTSDGVACTSTATPFDITAGGTVGVLVTLRCGAGGTVVVGSDAGNVRVNVGVERGETVICPAVDGLTALPLEVSVGNSVSLIGYATTAPATTFTWTAPAGAGSFSAASAASTSFTCLTVGDHLVTLSVGGAATCPVSAESVTVTCSPGALDASVPDASEPDAEVPDTSVPDADVPDTSVVPDAGAPDADVPDTSVPDAAEPDADVPDTSVPDAAEPDADVPDTSVPDAGQPDAEVPDTSVPDASVPDADVPDTSVPDSGPGPSACDTCRDTNCRAFQGIDLVAGCFERVDPDLSPGSVGDPLFIQQCINVVNCARANNCAYSETTGPAGCYCGNTTVDACQATGPAAGAPCVAEWQAATRTTVNADVQVRFTDVTYPAGWAYFILTCDQQNCVEAGCTAP